MNYKLNFQLVCDWTMALHLDLMDISDQKYLGYSILISILILISVPGTQDWDSKICFDFGGEVLRVWCLIPEGQKVQVSNKFEIDFMGLIIFSVINVLLYFLLLICFKDLYQFSVCLRFKIMFGLIPKIYSCWFKIILIFD